MVEHDKSGPLDWVTWSFSRIAMWAPFFIVLVILYEVIARYFFAAATLWANELSLWIGGGIYLSAGLYAMQQRSHIRIFILYDMAPQWLKHVFDTVSTICVWIFAIAVIWGSYKDSWNKLRTFELFGTAFDPPIPATIKPLILVMMFFLALQATSNLLRDWPASPWIRKGFDLIVSAVLLILLFNAANVLFFNQPENLKIPTRWLTGIAVFMIGAAVLVVYGLVKDFNKTPIPETGGDEIEEEAEFLRAQLAVPVEAPDEILSGNPPKPAA